MFAAARNDHRLGVPVQFGEDMPAEVLDDDFHLLADSGRMQGSEARHASLAAPAIQLWVVFYGFFELIVGFICHVILEHVQDELLLDRLPH